MIQSNMRINDPKRFGTIIRFAVAFVVLLLVVHLTLPVLGNSVWLRKGQRLDVDLSGELLTLQNKSVSLKELKGDVLFLNFWATWCGPCLMELPSMAVLHDELQREGLEVVAITNEDPVTVSRFLERNPMPFRILIDQDDQLAQRLRIWSIPMTLILDRQGKLVHFYQGARPWNTPDVLENIKMVLRE